MASKLEEYEGRVNHFYRDSVGCVTVGVGHLVARRDSVRSLVMFTLTNGGPGRPATLTEMQREFDAISALPRGYRADWYGRQATLTMRDREIDALLDAHIDEFYRELTRIYRRSRGYACDFDSMPRGVQLALFDMIFNLGATKIVGTFIQFDRYIKAGDWRRAAESSTRAQVSGSRNEYVRGLLSSAANAA